MIRDKLRETIRAGRRRGTRWVWMLDLLRALASSDGRANLWTRTMHRSALHQTGGFTWPDRYPELFELAARLAPSPRRILSFGCSTGAELETLRRRFPDARIVGAEINPRSRTKAARLMAADPAVTVVAPTRIDGRFDIIFALAVLQVEPHRIARDDVRDLSGVYPFARFDDAVERLAAMLDSGGLLCVMHAQYRVEDSNAAPLLSPVADSPRLQSALFGRDGRRLPDTMIARSIFRRRP